MIANNEESLPSGLYVVATPIGNLDDITLRALMVLRHVDFIAAEDTRHTRQLLQHFSINKPLFALHDHNELQQKDKIIEKIKAGQAIALVSDAGTPLISDPGFTVVRALQEQHLPVVTIPGPSALTAALSIAGLPCAQFVFEGFLPAKAGAREARLQQLKPEIRTQVFYASVHRVQDDVNAIAAVYGDTRAMVLLRELTKRHETVVFGTVLDVQQYLAKDEHALKGEFVLVVAGDNAVQDEVSVETERLLKILLPVVPLKQAVAIVSEILGVAKNPVYEMALLIKGSKEGN
jgi:16S rRNA (cytidine1402-2'-O)-methyltransferase